MKLATDLYTSSRYASVLRPHLPVQAFRPDPHHLYRIAINVGLVLISYLGVREAPLWVAPVFALLAGHSIACLGFLAHDVSHRAVVRSRFWIRVLELFLFGINLLPPTVWKRIHNQTHHAETNTVNDPDRNFLQTERTASVEVYSQLFHPGSARYLPRIIIFFNFMAYIVRNVYAALLEGGSKPSFVPFKPSYTQRQRFMISLEIVWIILIQVLVLEFLRYDWVRFLIIGPVALAIASSIAISYIATQHFLSPHCETSDPVVGSLSISVPRWVDFLHDNFSYHTEHHIFPGMNPRYYPLVSRLLIEHFPDRYQRISFSEAWRRLWKLDQYIKG